MYTLACIAHMRMKIFKFTHLHGVGVQKQAILTRQSTPAHEHQDVSQGDTLQELGCLEEVVAIGGITHNRCTDTMNFCCNSNQESSSNTAKSEHDQLRIKRKYLCIVHLPLRAVWHDFVEQSHK